MSLSPPAQHRVAVTAAGIVSPLGIGLEENHRSLQSAKDCIGSVHLFDATRCRSHNAGQVDDAALLAHQPKHAKRKLHRASYMMIAAAKEALQSDPAFQPERMVIGTTSGGMSFGESFYRSMAGSNGTHSNSREWANWLANYPPQKPVLDVQDALGFSAKCQIIANACASGCNAIGHGFNLIRNGLCKSVMTGGYDAISELVFVGFDSLQASTPEKCRPFDKGRTGLVLGEGAAILTLEEMESAIQRGAPILAEITGYGISTDNHHLTQPHPSGIGPLQAMQRALESARLTPSEIDYINAHGTATTFNDATEGTAIASLFGSDGPPVSSTKALMGHSLGAAGAIEAVFSMLAIQHSFLPPNANYNEPDPQWQLNIVANEARTAPLQRVMSNSFGFGGTNASLVIEKAFVEDALR